MPLDAIYLSALTKELKDKIEGGKIDKVQQPERDMLLISLRSKGENLRLLLSGGAGNARVHLTKSSFENPAEPPMFCMLLRKHLIGARINAVYQPDYERMLILELEGHDEMGFASSKKLIIEMIGRSSNVILVDSDGRIIDCMRRMDFGGDATRRMLPGMIYRLPPKQDKPPLMETDFAQREEMIENADRQQAVDKWLLNSFSGLSPLVCRELSYRCNDSFDTLPEQLDAFVDSVKEENLTPYILHENGKAKDFSFMRISQYGDAMSCASEDSFSALLDSFYSQRDKAEQQRRRSHQLFKTVRTIRDRLERKLAGQSEELRRTEDRDQVRKNAELVTANIYRMKKGDRVLECQDYYDPEGGTVRIELDPLKTPQQNAAMLYKEYNKLKTARTHLTKLIEEGQSQLDYLNSVLELLSLSETEKDISDIRRELVATGYIRSSGSSKADRSRAQAPWHFVTDDGFEVLAGRSNVQNDELTTKIGRRTDYWFHTQKVHGSHVILRCEGSEPTDLAISQAAAIAVFYSQGRDGGKTAVDYTMLKFVRKPSGALPGKVIYTDYKTIITEADEGLVNRLRK
jgi:predicted ribosome quality control (RQC) complex YloA/Tae2 family protein